MIMDQGETDKPSTKDTKGKSIATDLDDSPPLATGQDNRPGTADTDLDTASFMSRLGASTSKLARDAIFHPEGSAAYLRNGVSSSKGEISRPNHGTGSIDASTYKSNPIREPLHGAFKTTQTREQNIPGESDFSLFLDGADMPKIAETSNIQTHEYEQTYHPISGPTPQTPGAAATDGLDVVNLLESGYDEVEDTDIFLTWAGRETLRHRLFSDDDIWKDASERRQWEHALNFFPDPESNGNGIQIYADLLGMQNLEEAKSIWINQWQRVLSSYTEDVWGELEPLVKVARDELADLSRPDGEASPSHLKALHRLRQILNHIRGV
ncbi:hypothetical protein F5Y04DRAFT_258973 [Hypomontagnella monticulosa]|nr:hypothetical protein F5Y04DRAFT_258973 [Hypomontagnella monticulosa]